MGALLQVFREVSLLKQLSSDFITSLYESWADEQHIYLVMELAEMGDLTDAARA